MNRKHRGAFSELTACAWLLSQGYEVYRNVSAFGIIDLIAIRGAEILRLDVKTMGGGSLSEEQIQAGVQTILVSQDGICEIIEGRGRYRSEVLRCARCDGPFSSYRSNQKFCSPSCRSNFNGYYKKKLLVASA